MGQFEGDRSDPTPAGGSESINHVPDRQSTDANSIVPGKYQSRSSRHENTKTRGTIALNKKAILIIVSILVVAVVAIGAVAAWQNFGQSHDSKSVQGLFDQIKVEGQQGSPPVVSLSSPLEVTSVKSQVLEQGSGREITENSPVLLGIYPFSAVDGTVIGDDPRAELKVGYANEAELGAVLSNLVVGQSEGSRLLVVRPTTDGSTEIDVVDVLSTIANGEESEDSEDSAGPLEVSLADEGPIISHGKDAPTSLTVQTLLEGKGSQVRSGDRVVLQYLALSWSQGTVIASSWSEGKPQTINMDSAMVGLQEALIDKRVGSRLAITIPPELGTGDETIAVVVDILGSGPSS